MLLIEEKKKNKALKQTNEILGNQQFTMMMRKKKGEGRTNYI